MFDESWRSDEVVERKQVKVIAKSTVCDNIEAGFKFFSIFGLLGLFLVMNFMGNVGKHGK